MPWWSWCYFALYAALSIGGIYDDLRDRRRPLLAGSNILAFLFGAVFILAYWDHQSADVLGKGVVPMLIFALVTEAYSATVDLLEAQPGEGISKRSLQWIASSVLILVCLPAYIFGGILAMRVCGFEV